MHIQNDFDLFQLLSGNQFRDIKAAPYVGPPVVWTDPLEDEVVEQFECALQITRQKLPAKKCCSVGKKAVSTQRYENALVVKGRY